MPRGRRLALPGAASCVCGTTGLASGAVGGAEGAALPVPGHQCTTPPTPHPSHRFLGRSKGLVDALHRTEGGLPDGRGTTRQAAATVL